MKLAVFCLFAVFCYSVSNPVDPNNKKQHQLGKLQEVLEFLEDVKREQHSDKLLHTPPQNIKDCCSGPALQCFQENLKEHFKIADYSAEWKLLRSLRHPITKNAVKSCNSENNNNTCGDCSSHPKQNATEFFNRLESLIQEATARLSQK